LPTIQETAYPRLKNHVSVRDLAVIYTPNVDELALAKQVTRGAIAQLGFLVLLKIFQRLGYFVPISQVPTVIIEHIADVAQIQPAITDLAGYDFSGTRKRHLQIIRQTLHINCYGKDARHIRKRLFFPPRQTMPLDLKAQSFQSNSKAEIDLKPRVHSVCLV